jgi:hypothetical protein
MYGAYQNLVSYVSPRNHSEADRCDGIQTPQGFYAPAHLTARYDVGIMPSAASSWAEITGSEDSSELQVSDEVFAQIAGDIVAYGLALREQWKREASLVPSKRHDPPGLDLGEGPSGWGIEGHDLGDAGQGVPRTTKKRRIMDDEAAGVKRATQRAGNQGLPVRWTPTSTEEISEPGHRTLGIETLVVPLQGVSPPHQPGPSIARANPGSHGYASQAWTKEREGGSDVEETAGIEDAHDEKESDKDRWARLMKYDEKIKKWRCLGCKAKPFSDRSTLQRHCRSSAHEKERDRRQCPLCPENYLRQSNLNRHMEVKHPGWRGKVVGWKSRG